MVDNILCRHSSVGVDPIIPAMAHNVYHIPSIPLSYAWFLPLCAYYLRVMNMKNSREILSSVLKTTQMGQIGIRSVLDASMRPGLRKALESQLREYDAIETEAHSIASQRGWEVTELDPAIRMMSNMMTRMKLRGKNTDSKSADMMIQGNTKGMIKSLKDIHQFCAQDDKIQTLSQKLLDCENANIRQMQNYL